MAATMQNMNDVIDLISITSCSSSDAIPPCVFPKKNKHRFELISTCSSVSSSETENSSSDPNNIGPRRFVLNFSSGSSSSCSSSDSSDEEEEQKKT